MTKNQHGLLACMIGASTWGLNGVVSQFLFSHYTVEPSWLVTMRMCTAGLLLTAIALSSRRNSLKALLSQPANIRRLLAFALLGILLSQFTYLTAINYSNAGTATVLQTLSVVLMSIYLALRFHKKPSTAEIVSVFLGFGGVFLAATNGNLSTMIISPAALFWGLGSAVAAVTYPVLSQGLAARWGAVTVTGPAMILGGVIFGLAVRFWTLWPALDFIGWLACLFIFVFGTALSLSTFVAGISEIGPMKATLIGTLEPVVASVASAVFLDTVFQDFELLGYACIIATVFIIVLQKPQPGK